MSRYPEEPPARGPCRCKLRACARSRQIILEGFKQPGRVVHAAALDLLARVAPGALRATVPELRVEWTVLQQRVRRS